MQFTTLGGEHGDHRFAIFDDEFLTEVNGHKWHCIKRHNGTYYAGTNVLRDDGTKHILLMHQLIMPDVPDGMVIDHINGIGLDNRLCNLRYATISQNSSNRKRHKNKRSKYKGLIWNARAKKWEVRIMHKGVNYYLGLFVDEIEAARTYDRKAIELHKDYARLNFPITDYI